MFRKIALSTSLILILLVYAATAHAAIIDVNWTSCDNGFWSDPNNWNPSTVPHNNATDSFNVTIDTQACAGEIEVRIRQNRTVSDLTIYGDTDLESYVYEDVADIALAIVEDLDITLTLENALTNYGELEIGNLPLVIDGNIINHAHAEISGMDMTGNITNYDYIELDQTDMEGNVTNMAGATLEFQFPGAEINGHLHNLTGGTTKVQAYAEIKQGDVENSGVIEIFPLGQMMFENHFDNTGQILMKDGSLLYWDEENGPGILDNNSTGLIKGFGLIQAGSLIRNTGTIYAYGGSLTIAADGNLINEGVLSNLPPSSLHIKQTDDFNNIGTIQVHAGGGIGIDSNLVNQSNGVIQLLGGNLGAQKIVQQEDAVLQGFGVISTPTEILIESGAEIKLTGPTNIVGDVNIPIDATLEISDGQTLITGHTTCDGTIHLKGGTVIFQGGCDCTDCTIINEAGTDRDHFDINADGIVNLDDYAYFANSWLWTASWCR